MSQKEQAIASFLMIQDRARAQFAEAVEGIDKLARRLQELTAENERLRGEMKKAADAHAAEVEALQKVIQDRRRTRLPEAATEPEAGPEIHLDPAA